MEHHNGGITANVVCAAFMNPEPISWLWPGWLARGKLHVFAGPLGSGKSAITCAIAALLSTGSRWPDGTRAPLGNVVIWSGEDGSEDTIIPRLIAAGADRSRIFIVGQSNEGGKLRPFDPSRDLRALNDVIAEIEGGVSLIVIDPLVMAVEHRKDSHKNAETRQGLQHVLDFAA